MFPLFLFSLFSLLFLNFYEFFTTTLTFKNTSVTFFLVGVGFMSRGRIENEDLQRWGTNGFLFDKDDVSMMLGLGLSS